MTRFLAAFVLLFPALALAAPPNMPEYSGQQTITYDSHNHPAGLQEVGDMLEPGYNPDVSCAPHSFLWCDQVYDEAEANGLEALIQTKHTSMFGSTGVGVDSDLDRWKAQGTGFTPHVDGFAETYPTSASGLPAYSGFTDDEITSLWNCAEDANNPGTFLAIYGLEYTVRGASSTSADCNLGAGDIACGGHKILVPRTKPSDKCDPWGGPATCPGEKDVYDLIDLTGGVVFAAHPVGTSDTEWSTWNDPQHLGGVDDSVVGYEFRLESQLEGAEDKACTGTAQGAGGRKKCGFRQVLTMGKKVFPTFGQDNHHYHIDHDNCGGMLGGDGLPGNATMERGICWADAFTRAGLIDAFEAGTCYWADSYEPMIQWALNDQPMGSQYGVPPNAATTIEIEAENVNNNFNGWELICGDFTGGDGNATVAQSSTACDASSTCSYSSTVDTTTYKWCYLKVYGPTSNDIMALTAPIWITHRPDPSP